MARASPQRRPIRIRRRADTAIGELDLDACAGPDRGGRMQRMAGSSRTSAKPRASTPR